MSANVGSRWHSGTPSRVVIREAKRSAGTILDHYEQSAGALADFHGRVAATMLEPTASILAAYADLIRELALAQVSASRALLNL